MTIKPVSLRSTPLTFLRDFCVSTIRRETTSNYSKEKKPTTLPWSCGTSTRDVAYVLSSQQQPLLCAHPSVLSHGHKNLLIDCGDDLLSNDLLLSSSALLFWHSSSRSDDVWSPVASDVTVSAQQPQSNCLFATEKPTTHTHHGTSEQMKTNATKKHQFPSSEAVADATSRIHGLDNQPSSTVGATCEVCEVHKRDGPALLAFLPLRRHNT